MTFCFVCPPTPVPSVSKDRLPFHSGKSGLNVFVFKVKIRSRAQDWIWKLWCVTHSRHRGFMSDLLQGAMSAVVCPIPSRFDVQPWTLV